MVTSFVDFLKELDPSEHFFTGCEEKEEKAWNVTTPHRGSQFWTFFSLLLLYMSPGGL